VDESRDSASSSTRSEPIEEIEGRIVQGSVPEVSDELLGEIRARIEEVLDHGRPRSGRPYSRS